MKAGSVKTQCASFSHYFNGAQPFKPSVGIAAWPKTKTIYTEDALLGFQAIQAVP